MVAKWYQGAMPLADICRSVVLRLARFHTFGIRTIIIYGVVCQLGSVRGMDTSVALNKKHVFQKVPEARHLPTFDCESRFERKFLFLK